MPVRWTPETHEQLLVAIIRSGIISAWSSSAGLKIVEAWPQDKPAPTVSALTQQLNGLMKKHGVAPSTPGSRSAAPRGTPASKSSAGKAGHAGKGTYPDDSDDAEEGDEKIFKPSPSATPAPHGRKRRATLPPPSGLVERSGKRSRQDSPFVFIKSENGGVVDLCGDSDDDDDTPSKSACVLKRRTTEERQAASKKQKTVEYSQ